LETVKMEKSRKIGLFFVITVLCLLLFFYYMKEYISDHQRQLFGEVISRVGINV